LMIENSGITFTEERRMKPNISFCDVLGSMPEFIRVFSTLLFLFVFSYIFETIRVLGNVFLIARSFYQTDVSTLSDIMAKIAAALSTVLDPVYFGWLVYFYEIVSDYLMKLDLTALAINGLGVTCKGTQAPGKLFVNLCVIVGLIMLIELQFFPFVKITLNAFIQTSKKRYKQLKKSMILILMIGSCVGILECLFRYVAQLLASFMTYSDFFPKHTSSELCDEEYSGLDSITAGVATFMAFIFFWPACHMVLCVFIPGVPKNVSFPKLDWKMRLSVPDVNFDDI